MILYTENQNHFCARVNPTCSHNPSTMRSGRSKTSMVLSAVAHTQEAKVLMQSITQMTKRALSRQAQVKGLG